MNTTCTIYLVRHGKSKWNELGLIGGDSHLTDTGRDQAKILKERLHDIPFDAAYSSDSLRTKETAEIILSGSGITATPLASLRERFHGEYEGKKRDAIRKQLASQVSEFERLPESEKAELKLNPTMESEEEAVRRFEKALKEIAKNHPGQTVLIVTHGNIIRFLLQHHHIGTRESLPASAVKNTGLIKLSATKDSLTVDEVQDVEFSHKTQTDNPAVLVKKYL